MHSRKCSVAFAAIAALVFAAGTSQAAEEAAADAVAAEAESFVESATPADDFIGPDTEGMSPEAVAHYEAMRNLGWIRGPATVDVEGNSRLDVPAGYVFLDKANTKRFLEMNENLTDGQEVMIAPRSLDWTAYLSFADEGYVEDKEEIDAAELLKALQEGAEAGNKERARLGYAELHIIDWAVPPAYNATNKRLEWATLLESEGGRSANFSTKVLSRRGHTSIILVSAPEDLAAARPELESVLGGYSFVDGERYADFVPGDKVATYGLAALVLGGAAAIATKKGLWAVIGAFIISKIKILIVAIGGLIAALRKFVFGKKASDG